MQSEEKLLIQVVPRLTPTRCGVSDHAITLADALRSSFGIDTVFVVLNSNEQCELPYRVVHCDPRHLLACCCMVSGKRQGSLLVHVSGYGYSTDGAPSAVGAALEHVCESGRFPLAVYFHELFYAYNTPWKKAFWFSRKQEREVARIAAMCSAVVTNTDNHATWLVSAKHPAAKLHVMPVFSNIGESLDPAPWSAREPALVVFGQSDTRRRAYAKLTRMPHLLEQLRVERILDVGTDAASPVEIGSVKVERLGRLSALETSNLFSKTQFGFVRFAPNETAKSSVMAALCAFGVVPVLAESFEGVIDGVADGKQVVTPASATSADFEQCSRAAWHWYQQHSVNAHARVYRDWLMGTRAREVAAR